MSSKTLRASIQFVDPSLEGKDLSEIARHYQPHLRVQDDYLTSCFFERIGEGEGVMKLGLPYLTDIHLRFAEEWEALLGIAIEDVFFDGRRIELVAVNKVVASGVSMGVFAA